MVEKEKAKYKVEMAFGIIGGLILFLLGAVGSAYFYLKLIEFGRMYLGLGEDVLKYLEMFFRILAGLGGITVIIGSIFIGFGRRSIGSWFIGIGAGISLITLLLKVLLVGPLIQELVRNKRFLEAFSAFGFEFGLLGLGVFLSFLAMLTNYRWMIYMFLLSLMAMFVGATGDISLIYSLLKALNIPQEFVNYFHYFEYILLYIGVLFLLTTFIVGAGKFMISKGLVGIGLITIIPATITISTTLVVVGLNLVTLIRAITIYILLMGEAFFIIKAKPKQR